jgi:hypothetical protein
MIANLSFQGWNSPDRAPALRRCAQWLEEVVAERHPEPCKVRRLAREMRMRATELELGPHADCEMDELIEFMQRCYAHRPAPEPAAA